MLNHSKARTWLKTWKSCWAEGLPEWEAQRGLTRAPRSAPLKPSQCWLIPIDGTSTSPAKGTRRTRVSKIEARPAGSGNGTYSSLSSRPGLSNAESTMSGLPFQTQKPQEFFKINYCHKRHFQPDIIWMCISPFCLISSGGQGISASHIRLGQG